MPTQNSTTLLRGFTSRVRGMMLLSRFATVWESLSRNQTSQQNKSTTDSTMPSERIGLFCTRHLEWYETECSSCIGHAVSDTKPSNPKDEAASDRVDFSLIPDTALVALALALQEGHQKYGAYNWRVAGVLSSVYVAANRRHVGKWWNGLDVDSGSTVKELGHAMACLAILIDAEACGKLNDDRPPSVDLAKILEDARKTVRHIQEKFGRGPGRYTQRQHGDNNEL